MAIESLMLEIAGGIVGLGFARAGIDLLVALRPESLRRLASVSMDLRVLLFAFAATLVFAMYAYCTPLANPVSAATDEQRAAAEREIGKHGRISPSTAL